MVTEHSFSRGNHGRVSAALFEEAKKMGLSSRTRMAVPIFSRTIKRPAFSYPIPYTRNPIPSPTRVPVPIFSPPTNRSFSSTNRTFSPTNRTFSSTNRTFSPTNGSFSPTNRTFSPTNDSFSPTNGTFSPTNGSFSPTNGSFSPTNRSFSSTNRSFSPTNRSFPLLKRSFPTPNGLVVSSCSLCNQFKPNNLTRRQTQWQTTFLAATPTKSSGC